MISQRPKLFWVCHGGGRGPAGGSVQWSTARDVGATGGLVNTQSEVCWPRWRCSALYCKRCALLTLSHTRAHRFPLLVSGAALLLSSAAFVLLGMQTDHSVETVLAETRAKSSGRRGPARMQSLKFLSVGSAPTDVYGSEGSPPLPDPYGGYEEAAPQEETKTQNLQGWDFTPSDWGEYKGNSDQDKSATENDPAAAFDPYAGAEDDEDEWGILFALFRQCCMCHSAAFACRSELTARLQEILETMGSRLEQTTRMSIVRISETQGGSCRDVWGKSSLLLYVPLATSTAVTSPLVLTLAVASAGPGATRSASCS
eukprot:3025951-Rhodomonas_salina.1